MSPNIASARQGATVVLRDADADANVVLEILPFNMHSSLQSQPRISCRSRCEPNIALSAGFHARAETGPLFTCLVTRVRRSSKAGSGLEARVHPMWCVRACVCACVRACVCAYRGAYLYSAGTELLGSARRTGVGWGCLKEGVGWRSPCMDEVMNWGYMEEGLRWGYGGGTKGRGCIEKGGLSRCGGGSTMGEGVGWGIWKRGEQIVALHTSLEVFSACPTLHIAGTPWRGGSVLDLQAID